MKNFSLVETNQIVRIINSYYKIFKTSVIAIIFKIKLNYEIYNILRKRLKEKSIKNNKNSTSSVTLKFKCTKQLQDQQAVQLNFLQKAGDFQQQLTQ